MKSILSARAVSKSYIRTNEERKAYSVMPGVVMTIVDRTSGSHNSSKSWLSSIRQLSCTLSSCYNLLQSAGERSTLLQKLAVPLTCGLEGAWNAKVDTWHSVETPAGSVWQGCTKLLRRAWMTCKQTVRKLHGEGTAQSRCSGPVKELHKERAQGLRDRDCIQTVRRVWVTGILYRQCAGSEWQGLYTDSAQGLSDRDCIQTVRRV
jgi:hypothetical protein